MKITKTQNSRLVNTNFNKLEFGRTFSDHMLMCKFQEGQWQEAEILPYQPISFAPGTHVFHYGQAVFEGMKAFKNKQGQTLLFRPEANMNRLNQSANRLCMPSIPSSIFMDGLKNLDPVAYVRFASVYRNFREEKDFVTFVDRIDVYKKR